jgi:uncharacterized damage-inducible protein DinB
MASRDFQNDRHAHRQDARPLQGLGRQGDVRWRCRPAAGRGRERERKTLFKSIIGTLNHIYVVDLIWKAHLEGREHGFSARNLMLHSELPALWAAQQKINHWFIDWAAAQSHASLDEDVPFKDMKEHLTALHRRLSTIDEGASYHRGWVAEMFLEADARPPQPDLSVFLCEAPRDWRASL